MMEFLLGAISGVAAVLLSLATWALWPVLRYRSCCKECNR